MPFEFQKQTVSDTLWEMLEKLMGLECLADFRLVGGTAISLQIGHRISVDIDMFTDADYGTIDFLEILAQLKQTFAIVSHGAWTNDTIGNSCFLGNEENNLVKLDLFYVDPYVYPILETENIRYADLEELVAMKLETIGGGGRKKDFWDIHAFLDKYSLAEMFAFYSARHPYNYSSVELLDHLVNFERAESEPDPICLTGKYWQLIKLDFEEAVAQFKS